jgi:hypothetical protein
VFASRIVSDLLLHAPRQATRSSNFSSTLKGRREIKENRENRTKREKREQRREEREKRRE